MTLPLSPARSPDDALAHLRTELARILQGLARCLHAQRERGRTPVADVMRGLVIEEGETEGLVAELAAELAGRTATGDSASRHLPHDGTRHADYEAGRASFPPLRQARHAFDLAAGEYDAVVLALGVELDPRFGRIVAYLNDHAGRTRPTLGLAMTVGGSSSDVTAAAALLERPFLRDGLLEIEGDGPLPGLTVRVPREVIGRLAGRGSDLQISWLAVRPADAGLLDRLVLEEHTARQLAVWGETLRARRTVPHLIVAGPVGSGRATAGGAALFRAGMPVIQVDISADNAVERLRAARREARWCDAAVLVRLSAESQQPIDWPSVWRALDIGRPVVLVLTGEQIEAATAGAGVEPAVVRLDEPGVALRARLWPALLPAGAAIAESEVAELAARFPFGPGRMARSIQRATADLALRPAGERRLDFASLMAAARVIDSAAIGPLAQKMPLPYERTELIVPPHVAAELDLAIAWVRHRHRVLHEWGFVRRVTMGHGLTALFSGPSGTGKTMAAQVLARELGLDLYRIDLSQIMSKYIGETEKNLAVVFGARVGVLFFDEAEVILGRRHETKDARDRYANVEIAYLLQRMEEYDGVTVLATNRMHDIDEAFIRRLHVVVEFPMPSEADRLRIWEGMLPAAAERAADLDLRALAREFEISGGQIKNAALAGAFLAAACHQSIGMEQLRQAARRELVKSGKIV